MQQVFDLGFSSNDSYFILKGGSQNNHQGVDPIVLDTKCAFMLLKLSKTYVYI